MREEEHFGFFRHEISVCPLSLSLSEVVLKSEAHLFVRR